MLQRRNTLLAKVESTYATDPIPVATDAISVIDLSVTPEGEKLERQPFGGSLSPVAHLIGQKWADISFSVNGRGSGAAYSVTVLPEMSPLLRACGLIELLDATPGAEKVTYQPISTTFESCTIYAYLDGKLHKITGCRGTVEIVKEAGQFVKFSFTMSGLYQTPTDGAFVAGSYNSTVPPKVSNVGFTVGGYGAIVTSLQVALNNEVSKLKDLNSAGRVEIVGRGTAGSFDPEAVTEATHQFWANWENSTPEVMTASTGATQYNIMQLDIAQAVYDSLAWGDKDGIRKYDMPFSCARLTGDDEMTLTFR